MESMVERGCGLDVHQATVVACVIVGKAGAKPRKETRTFRTVTRELLALRDWLKELGVTHVAMESTGVYWKPVYALLEDDFELVVGNAQHIKNVPGRKTDIKDSAWLADLLRHGLIRKSFVPPKPLRALRELTRYRRTLVESRAAERNRLQKLLEAANIKLASFISDVFGASGMAMLRALLANEADPAQMAQLAKGRMRSKVADLELALEGRLDDEHRFVLALQLERLGQADATLAALDARIEAKMAAYEPERQRLMTIPGIDRVLAAVLVAEVGVDMTVFPSAAHLASWAGLCPGNHESAGERKSSQTRKGNVHLKTGLVEAANAASRKKGSYLKDKFFRLKVRRGHKRAILALGHKILVAAYHVLAKATDYVDLGGAYLDTLNTTRVANQLKRRLERLGYEVALQKVEPTQAV